ncbi:hypothetical protein MPK66_gp188 [Erwinia phage pEa_SNUABM_2]|uniref:Uncharacterized protein n=1 Tax=Erwinia phage pEa_SNUABM_2 TaxID=2869547 RepID=A0AAE7XPX4_9CAUD|nr:hypothetical protein MPK66_gp188 [Erwinia phage pEa_SNUABM_2]QZE59432.1 hypothetical protein pEaSNUABM2_00188 [Erwinia phage pEa_SNUABM_2]QZE59768.1 hypothetical protein pEaSNUABM39_00188 [Erwinia phage pEa_SNUABM_39]
MKLMVSMSALPPSQYRKYRKGWKPNPALLALFEKISGKKGHKAMRIYIDAKTDAVIKNIVQNVKPPIQIVDALMEKDIVLVDYIAGTGKDTHGRIVKIGKYLAKDAALKKMFDSDPQRKAIANASRNHQLICISMHPYDIAGMSTDRGWVSCMNLKGGANKKFVKQDIANGTLISYLIDPKDKNINKPVARALVKPYFQKGKTKVGDRVVGSEKVNALYLVDFAYPDSTMPFIHTLQEWLNEHINPFIATTERKGVFELHSKLYEDRRAGVFDYDLEAPLMNNDVNKFIDGIVASKDTENAEAVVVDYLERFPVMATMLAKRKWGTPEFQRTCVRELIGNGKYDDLPQFFSAIQTQYAGDTETLKNVWEATSGRPRAMDMFLRSLPNERRDSFVSTYFADAELYSVANSDTVLGTLPKAPSEIWNLVKYTSNPESLFWYTASRINTAGIMTRYVEEEFGTKGGREYKTYVLTPAIGSLALQNPKCSVATLHSLEQHKDRVDANYYRAAKMVFDGYKYLRVDDRESIRPRLHDTLSNKKLKLNKTEIDTLAHRIDYGHLVQVAVEELFPSAIDLSGDGEAFLVDTNGTLAQMTEQIIERTMELVEVDAIERVTEMRAKSKAHREKMKARK